MAYVGRDHIDHRAQTSLPCAGGTHQTRMPKAPSILALSSILDVHIPNYCFETTNSPLPMGKLTCADVEYIYTGQNISFFHEV